VPIVVDASIVLAYVLEESLPPGLDLARLERDEWVVPALWWFEIRNGLVVNERRRRISEDISERFINELAGIATAVDDSPDSDNVMLLARKYQLTVYDAAYLEVAIRLGLPLATLDTDLIDAAWAEAVALVGDASP